MLFLLLAFLLWVGNVRLVVSEHAVLVSVAPAGTVLTVAQLSDIHGRRFGGDGRRLLRLLERSAPDIVVVTGDLVSVGQRRWDHSVRLMAQLASRYPVYYVRGNHEAMRDDHREIEARLRESGVFVLSESRANFERDGLTVVLLGIPDPESYGNSLRRFEAAVRKLVDEAEDASVNVLLSHRPELARLYVSLGVDLVLAGHAHGGQVRMPGVGGLYAPDQGFRPRYTEGAHLLRGAGGRATTLIVSRGAGGSWLLPRIFNPPEIVLVRLVAKGR